MTPGTQEDLKTALKFARTQSLAVLSTVTPQAAPQSALMGVAVTPDFEIVFDTVRTSRKYGNLRANPTAALVLGCSSETTIQFEGIAEELAGEALEKYQPIYFAAFPDGPQRQSWPGITWFVVRPTWIRYCDYDQRPPFIREFQFT
jgi:pyridoxine/pyridoxamine 5'-phosphate oxidase